MSGAFYLCALLWHVCRSVPTQRFKVYRCNCKQADVSQRSQAVVHVLPKHLLYMCYICVKMWVELPHLNYTLHTAIVTFAYGNPALSHCCCRCATAGGNRLRWCTGLPCHDAQQPGYHVCTLIPACHCYRHVWPSVVLGSGSACLCPAVKAMWTVLTHAVRLAVRL